MKDAFCYILENYKSASKKIDGSTQLSKIITRDLPEEIKTFLHRNDIKVMGSMGKGITTLYPWITILNESITKSPQYGIYIGYLFKSDMSGFYLTLTQGITNFKNLFSRDAYTKAQKTVKYFQSQIESQEFETYPIDLNSERNDRGYGYEQTTIISKFYSYNNIEEERLRYDLLTMLKIYDDIVQHMSSRNYDQLIKDVLEHENRPTVKVDDAITEISQTLNDDNQSYFEQILEEKVPFVDRSKKYKRITQPIIRKIDFIKKAEKEARIGLKGEELALEYEQNRLIKLGRADLAERIEWVSREGDGQGYDIKSFEVDDRGNVTSLMIEVKATASRIDTPFFVSVNEKYTSDRLKEKYCLFRIYDITAERPKFYRMKGKIEDNFELDPISYMATLK